MRGLRFAAANSMKPEMRRLEICAVLSVLICSACTEVGDGSSQFDYLTLRSAETTLKIPSSYHYKAKVPWTAVDMDPGEAVHSLLLQRSLSEIQGLELAEGTPQNLLFQVSAWSAEERESSIVVQDRLVKTANASGKVVAMDGVPLYRVFEADFTFKWLLTDRQPPVGNENVVANCVQGTFDDDLASCNLMEFHPIPDFIVSVTVVEPLVAQRNLIVDDIATLVRSWRVGNQSTGME